MDKNREIIETYIKYLNLGQERESSIKEKADILNFIESLDTYTIDSNKCLVAELFCKVISTLKTENIGDEELRKGIINAFKNIKNMKDYDENEQKENSNSYLMVIAFLKKLNDMNDMSHVTPVIDANMHSQFEELSEILESIRIIFKIEDGDKVFFPLAKLLSEVISSEKFKIEGLDITTINTLLLALEVFSTTSYKKEQNQLNMLIDKCNIKCLKYLKSSTVRKIGESNWKNNFENNGVLILVDIVKHSVLIRHESKSYFSNTENFEKSLVEDELNSEGIRIASYYEYNFDSSGSFISFECIIEKNNKKLTLEALNLIYKERNYNVFHKQAFLHFENRLTVVNPFTINDTYIIKELNSAAPVPASASHVTKDCIAKYYLEIIEQNGLNCACLGLICNLLEIEPLDTFTLLSNLNSQKPYQNQIISNWIKNTKNPEINLIEIQNKFFSSLRYVSKKNDIYNAQFKGLFLYPIKFEEELVDLIIKIKYKFEELPKYNFHKSKYTTDFSGTTKIIEIEGAKQNNNDVYYYDKDDEFTDEENLFVIKTNDNKIHVSKLISLLGELKEKISIENEKLLDYDTIDKFTSSQISFVEEYMMLHKEALMKHTNNSINFNSVVKFRLINNILYYRLHAENRWQVFLKILGFHEKITFENIKDIVNSNDSGVLYVPKEKDETDSVLSSIVPEYLKNKCQRDPGIYTYELELVDSEYGLRGHKISEIVILFDTLQSGTSTTRTLDFYFEKYGEKNVGRYPNRTVIYYAEGKPIKLMEILKTNNAKLKVVFLNGTYEGELKIKEYFTKLGIEAEITCLKYNTLKADENIINLSKELYDDCSLNIGNYPIIREFNQPKKNVFPKEMLDVERVFSLFVKKKELW